MYCNDNIISITVLPRLLTEWGFLVTMQELVFPISIHIYRIPHFLYLLTTCVLEGAFLALLYCASVQHL